ncbi:glycosyltransferase family 2 protein [Bacillus paranthracis]|uniref:glycosyltransferase family 2 protein n=1 Tax=Bacillus paranthracis TaxID=2026186 RepID=UPI0018CF47E5|nr:glycosyltransferase family A protein [Bacillus paranthracis]MBG9909773.1 glycosyl transferase family 2 [Bacillus paranthracis]
MKQPLVSVIIPSYNPGELIEFAVKSVENQTYANKEIIIIDDGSTDGTLDWLESNKSRFKYVTQKNSGASSARNNGVNIAAGDFIAFLDADDIWFPDKLEKQMGVFKEEKDISFVFSNGLIIHDDIEVDSISLEKHAKVFDLYTLPPRIIDFDWNFRIHSVPTSSLLVRKVNFMKVGGFPSLVQGEDFALIQLLLTYNKGYAFKEPLMCYRRHQNNTSSSIQKASMKKRLEKILNKDLARITLFNILKENNHPMPKIINKYRLYPVPFRMLALFTWRFKYGANKNKVKRDIINYLTGRG